MDLKAASEEAVMSAVPANDLPETRDLNGPDNCTRHVFTKFVNQSKLSNQHSMDGHVVFLFFLKSADTDSSSEQSIHSPLPFCNFTLIVFLVPDGVRSH
jgi:hypothetical protein